ncbi:MAG: acetoin utilization protein AcuC [Thermoleophilia bacterium]
MSATAFVYGPHLQAHNPSADTERRMRRELGIALLEAYGLLEHTDVVRHDPRPATDAELLAVHAPEYVDAVRRIDARPELATQPDERRWGFADGDTVPHAGMHEAAMAACGSAVTGALEIWEGRALRAFCPAPAGLHHALRDRATGMCIYNDAAVAIQVLLDRGAQRVAYIDVDAHHGNGVQWIFYEDPRVLTCSVHESGRYLYPGTGHLGERGVGAAEGTSVNVPLPPFAGDASYLGAVDHVIGPAVRRFAPEVVVMMTGVDPHHADPMAHLQVTTAAFPELYARLRGIADDAAGGRWLTVTGGGYNIDLLPRLWALQLACMLDVELPEALPAAWLAMAAQRAGREFTSRLLGDEPIQVDEGSRANADAQAFETIEAARTLFGLVG